MSNKQRPSRNGLRICAIVLLFFASLIAPVWIIGHQLGMPYYLVVPVVFLPFITLLGCILYAGKIRDIGSALTSTKYFPLCPLIFYYDEEPCKYYRFKGFADLKKVLQRNDVLLRRQDRFLDGLVLGQTSYFTHAAIYCGDDPGDVHSGMVLDAIGARGVGYAPLEDFAKCDDIAVVRFTTDHLAATSKGRGSEFIAETLKGPLQDLLYPEPGSVFSDEILRIRIDRLIKDDIACEVPPTLAPLGHEEKNVYDALMKSCSKSPASISRSVIVNFMPAILKIGENYYGRKYDYFFDFSKEDRVSCVEFVWDCYKALYPLHQVRRKVMYYFGVVKTMVLVPDLFLESDCFELVYSSWQGVDTAKKLYHRVRRKYTRFWKFAGGIILWQGLLIFLLYLLYKQ